MLEYWTEENRRRSGDQVRRNWEDPDLRERMTEAPRQWWANYPGGFNAWIQTFPEEKQKQIMQAIHADRRNRGVAI